MELQCNDLEIMSSAINVVLIFVLANLEVALCTE